jgi:quercetin dioxygenase-like cupin family protein
MRKLETALLGGLSALILIAGHALADEGGKKKDKEKGQEHAIVIPGDLEWKEAPVNLPSGAKLAVLEGDPAKAAPFTMRLKMPAGYRIPPHSHPAIEHVTVIEGTCALGFGDKWDEKKMKELTSGSFAFMEPGHNHFALAKTEAIVQMHGVGPWGIKYVNPADDPSRQAKK